MNRDDKVKVLFLSANPRDKDYLDIDREFREIKEQIRLVILNACFTGTQAKVIARTIDSAIGMSFDIGDDAAMDFAAAFYRALGFGKSVQRAFDEARLELMLKGIEEEDAPRLFTREGIDADRLFPVGSLAAELGKTDPAQAPEFIKSFISFLNTKRRNWQVICLRPLTVPNITEADYFKLLLDQIHGSDAVLQAGNRSAGKSPSMQFDKTLRQIIRRTIARVIVIFNSLGKSDPCHLQVVVSMLKALADDVNNKKFNLVFIGYEKLHSLCYYGIRKKQSSLHIAETVHLPDLSESETVSLIMRELPETEAGSAIEIYHLTGGYYGILRHAIEYFRECGGDLSRLTSTIEKNAHFFSELRITLLNNPDYLDEFSRWLENLPEYYRDLSNMKNRQLFWLGLLKVEADRFSWRCKTVRLIVEKIGQVAHQSLEGFPVLFERFHFLAKTPLQIGLKGCDLLFEPMPENQVERAILQTAKIDIRTAPGDQVRFDHVFQKGLDSVLVDVQPEGVLQIFRRPFPVRMLAQVQHEVLGNSGVDPLQGKLDVFAPGQGHFRIFVRDFEMDRVDDAPLGGQVLFFGIVLKHAVDEERVVHAEFVYLHGGFVGDGLAEVFGNVGHPPVSECLPLNDRLKIGGVSTGRLAAMRACIDSRYCNWSIFLIISSIVRSVSESVSPILRIKRLRSALS